MQGTRRLMAGSLVLVLALPATGGARTGPEPSGAPGSQRLAERIAAAQPRETPAEDLLAGVLGRDRTDVAARGRALRTFLSETWLTDDAAQAEEPEELNGAVAWAWPAGDLTGDDRADVLVDSWSWTEQTHLLQALRGSDGEELWRIESSDWNDAVGWPAGTDLTGDGADDLLVWSWTLHDHSTGDDCLLLHNNCTMWEELSYEWRLAVRSGRDGTLAWSQTYEGTERWEEYRSESPLGSERRERVEATNALVLPFLAGDHDGDGLDDLVVNVVGGTWESIWSSQYLFVASRWEDREQLRATTRAQVLSGADGVPTDVRFIEDTPVVGRLRPVDLDGGSLMWWSWTHPERSSSCESWPGGGDCSIWWEPASAELEMLDGQTFATRWHKPIDTDVFIEPLGADLDGDGHAEVVQARFWLDDEERPDGRMAIVSGADGTLLWEREGWVWPRVVGSLDGSPGVDVLVGSSQREGDQVSVLAERVDGATGDTLFTTFETVDLDGADDVFVSFSFSLLGDGTGDGIRDIGWEAHRLWIDEGCRGDERRGKYCWWVVERVESRLRAEATRTGETLYASEPGGYAELRPAGDLDGDGADEVFEVAWGEGDPDWTAVRLTDGVRLWSVAHDGWSWLVPAGDQTGDGAFEVLRQIVSLRDSEVSTLIASLDGRTAAERWSLWYGDDAEPQPTPPEQG